MHFHLDRCRLRRIGQIAIHRLHLKEIFPHRQIAINHLLLARHLPVRIVPIQSIDIGNLIGPRLEATPLKLEGQIVLSSRQANRRVRWEIPSGDDSGDADARRRNARPEARQSSLGGDPIAAIPSFNNLVNAVVHQAVPLQQGLENPAIVPTHAPAESAEPQMPLMIFHDVAHVIVAQAVGGGETGEILSIETTHPTTGGEPQIPLLVLYRAVHPTPAQAIGCGEVGELKIRQIRRV